MFRIEELNKDNIKQFILEESSVIEFSEYWNSYYDWCCAGAETMQAYAQDINKHKEQVRELLSRYTDEEVFNAVNEEAIEKRNELANNILKRLGYKFIETK